eukprot:GFUD01020287.1.p1 GENE.GFUD01020287.1~~GFUD01020287.1.p1  ORF type:complete len:684 (-),score=240.80 GFUD01020287.1:177-2228(-)
MTDCQPPPHIPLSSILHSFSAPISEEHGWAIIHQACTTLQLMDTSHTSTYLVGSTNHILLTVEGMVHSHTFTQAGRNRKQMVSFTQAVEELGVAVYTALDYSLPEDESRTLSGGLENVIDIMTSADQREEEGDESDEGIGEEEKGGDIVGQVIALCRHHLAVPEEATDHYRNVVRALVAESSELRQFMSNLGDMDLIEMDKGDWAGMWTQVMGQLRNGCKLKKVDFSKTPAEFGLTPYEMLMDDIRTKKYQLTPVTLPEQVQRGAREVILDFIRSRPPLKPAAKRQLAILTKQPSQQEMLMDDLRGDVAKMGLKKTKTVKRNMVDSEGVELGKVVEKEEVVAKKVIDLDQSFADNILNFDECGDTDHTDTSPDTSTDNVDNCTDNSEEATVDPPKDITNRNENNNILSSITTPSTPSTPSLLRSHSSTILSTISSTLSDLSPSTNKPSTRSTSKKSKYTDWIKTLHTLDLTLEEVSHIRSQLTKAELEELDLPPDRKKEYEKGRTCFLCGLVRFGLFNWAVLCQLCRRYVCSSCVSKIALPSDKLKDIPVCSLTTQLSKDMEKGKQSTVQSTIPPATSTSNLSNFSRGYERHSLRSTARSSTPVSQAPSKPRLTRAKSMDKSMAATIQAMKLTGTKTGIQHSVCTDCKDMLTSIVRAQRMAAKLDRMRGGFRGLGGRWSRMVE